MEYLKNQTLTTVIEDMGADGEGIGKVGGYTLFVKDALLGDEVLVKLTKVKKNYAYARLEKVLKPSSFRIEAPCAFSRACGGCQIQSLAYENQLYFKQRKVKNNLVRLGGFKQELVEEIMQPIIGMDQAFRYRNKAQYPIGLSREGRPIAGFYAGRTHDIIANTDCLLGAEENSEIIKIVLSYMEDYGVAPYSEETHTGMIRHVLIRKGFATNELMVCIIINGESLPNEEELCKRLNSIPHMTSISVNVNMDDTNVIMGRKVRILSGKTTIEDVLGGIRFAISPLSFYQVNPVQTEQLYKKALEFAELSGKETVWDLYCGIGTISLFMAKKARHVYGVEIIPEAIDDAQMNASKNAIDNVTFFVGKAEEVLPDFYDKESMAGRKAHADVIVIDPPRKGCDEICLDTMLKMQPERIVYVSCDSATLARDLKILCAEENDEAEGYARYQLEKIQCVDMFPQTTHVETVVALHRTNS